MQTAVEFIKEELNRLGLLDRGQVMTNIFEQAKQIEYNQKGYTKEDVLKAGEIGEINHHDYKHIVKLLDEARLINETYGSKGSDVAKRLIKEMPKHIADEVDAYAEKLVASSQKEISDEEILNIAKECVLEDLITSIDSFVLGAKMYRETIKIKK